MSDTATLSELIEHERAELMQIHAMVRCLNDVLLYADDDDSPMHADVALVIARLLNDSVGRLEGVRMRVAQLEQAVTPPNQVRELGATYWVSRAPAPHLHDIRRFSEAEPRAFGPDGFFRCRTPDKPSAGPDLLPRRARFPAHGSHK